MKEKIQDQIEAYSLSPMEDRAAGAIMGSLIGDALGVGPHWFYSLKEMDEAYGGRITGYAPVLPGRYHEGVELGDVSQTGQCQQLLIESIVEKEGYNEEDYINRLDGLLDTLDGTPEGGRFTEQAIRDIWRSRKKLGKEWKSEGFASLADTSEGAQRAAVIAARYSHDLMSAGRLSADCTKLTNGDPSIVTSSTAFGCLIGALISGIPLDQKIGWAMRNLIKEGKLPFTHAVLAEEQQENLNPSQPTKDLPFPDILLGMGWWVQSALDPAIKIDPPEKISKVYGMACPLIMVMPGAFYLAARFSDSFEDAVLTAINAGGNNMARAALTGALSGAMNGLSKIPPRFIEGLKDYRLWMDLAVKIAKQSTA